MVGKPMWHVVFGICLMRCDWSDEMCMQSSLSSDWSFGRGQPHSWASGKNLWAEGPLRIFNVYDWAHMWRRASCDPSICTRRWEHGDAFLIWSDWPFSVPYATKNRSGSTGLEIENSSQRFEGEVADSPRVHDAARQMSWDFSFIKAWHIFTWRLLSSPFSAAPEEDSWWAFKPAGTWAARFMNKHKCALVVISSICGWMKCWESIRGGNIHFNSN